MTLFNPGPALPTLDEADAEDVSRDDARLLLAMRHEMVNRTVDECCMRGITSDWPPFFVINHHREAIYAQPVSVNGSVAFGSVAQVLLRGIMTREQAERAVSIIKNAHTERIRGAYLRDDFQLPKHFAWHYEAGCRFHAYVGRARCTGRYAHIDPKRKDNAKVLAYYAQAVARDLLQRRDRESLGELQSLWQARMQVLSDEVEAARTRARKIERLVERANEEPEPDPEPSPPQTLAEFRYWKAVDRGTEPNSYYDPGTGMPRRAAPVVPLQTPGR